MPDKKSYIYTIPINVRHHKKLTAGAKLLYGEIELICNQDGYCQKRNDYFAKLYGVRVWTISKWVGLLQKSRFIKCKIRKKYMRIIFLQNADEKTIRGVLQNLKGVSAKPQDNTTYYTRGHPKDAPAVSDLVIETKQWTDDKGKKHSESSIDYED